MANTINRAYPGDLSAGNGLTFRSALNSDRTTLYAHVNALQAAIEKLSGAALTEGTSLANTVDLTIDSPAAGTVYCPAGYVAIIDGAPVVTSATISQVYTPGSINYVFLVVSSAGVLSLRCALTATAGAGEILVASISATPTINNAPAGKPYARISMGTAADGSAAGILDAEFQVLTTSATPDAENTIAHGLGRTPVGYIVIAKDKAADIYTGTTAWTSTNIYLNASVASATVTVLIF